MLSVVSSPLLLTLIAKTIKRRSRAERECSTCRHVDALEAKVRELERSSNAPQLSETQLSLPPTREVKWKEEQSIGNADDLSSHSKPRWPAGDLDVDIKVDNSAHIKDGSTDPADSSRSHGTRKRYGKSSTLHFALNVKASATAMNEGSDVLSHRKRRLSVSSGHSVDLDVQSASSPLGDDNDGDDEPIVENAGRSPNMPQLLPHRHLAKILLDKYFEAIHPIWPLLLEYESRDSFDMIWTSDEPPKPLWIVQLNLIMCLSCHHYDGNIDSKDLSGLDLIRSGKDFYRRAQDYVYANAFSASSIGMLQALLLMAQYQQGAMRFNEFYLTIGHAARMAQSLGLHISRPESISLSPQHQELYRRLWWGCFCLDR